ncbi:TPA: hypothetical protein KDX79_003442 [Vibrio parahaemolyticus]|nr:hypothetical protein [Vibrio parahaemolyticus]HBH7870664.1 hypothetical protein [Vibrio parahaemolyticus]
MSQLKAQETINRLISWIAERDELNDFGEYRNGDKVNRANLIDEGVLKRSQLSVNGNPKLRELLVEAERRWYGESNESIASHNDARERAERRSNQNSAEVSRLRKELAEVKAELSPLKSELASLRSENQELRQELGIQKSREAAVVRNYGELSGWD